MYLLFPALWRHLTDNVNQLVHSSPISIQVTNNQVSTHWLGISPEKIQKKHKHEILVDSAFQKLLPFIKRVMSCETVMTRNYHFPAKNHDKEPGRASTMRAIRIM